MLRHPRRVLGLAAICIAILGGLGIGVEADLAPSSPSMPGSESARADSQLKRYFGEAAPFAVLLRGPAAQIDRQGPRLIRALRKNPKVTTLSPWDRGALDELRPAPGRVLILVDFHDGLGEAVEEDVADLEGQLERQITAPVRAVQSGYASYLQGVKESSDSATEQGDMIVFPVLIVLLLLVFRSPVAAAVPLLLGAGTVICARGVLTLLTGWLEIDSFALPVSGMIGLALGVDYTLLMVSRFREELARGADPLAAAIETRRTAGRTVLAAGGTLFVSLFIALLFVPGRLYTSVIGSMLLVTGLSVLLALVVAPAVLVLLGQNVNRWRLGGGSRAAPRWMGWVTAALRRPAVTVAVIAAVMVVLAGPIVFLQVGSSGPGQLPRDSSARRNAALIDHYAGPGWGAPFVVVASTDSGAITDPQRFAAIDRWQKRIGKLPGVQTVVGPGSVVKRVTPLRRAGDELLNGQGSKRVDRVQRLGARLERAAGGVGRLQDGLISASQGAGLLGDGSGRAEQGALLLAKGLRQASHGAHRGAGATRRLARGSKRLAKGQRVARFGALELKLGLQGLQPIVGREGFAPARALQSDLAARAKEDPDLRIDSERAARLARQFAVAKGEVRRLRRLAAKLHSGLGSLAKGTDKVRHGTQLLAHATGRLTGGLERLDHGSERLAAGLTRLTGGARALESNLASGAGGTSRLHRGLSHAGVAVSTQGESLDNEIGRLRQNTPGIFNSGQFVISALDGTGRGRRQDISQTVDLDGGQAVRMLVVSKFALNSAGSRGLYDRLRVEAGRLERDAAEVTVGVGGGEAQIADFAEIAGNRFPISAAAITIATFLMLVIVLRALLLPAIAVLLNLASVAIAFGVLSLIGRIPAGYPLGGNGVVDVTGATAIFTVAFALSIDYAVFLLTRMRETYNRTGDHQQAIQVGLESTGRVITGAAAVMGAVFLAFATVPVVLLSQMGIGLAVAVLVDATIIRLVLLPALMMLVGPRVWALPPSLGRMLPSRPAVRKGDAG